MKLSSKYRPSSSQDGTHFGILFWTPLLGAHLGSWGPFWGSIWGPFGDSFLVPFLVPLLDPLKTYFGNLSWQGNGKRVAIFFLLRCTKQSGRNNSLTTNHQTYVGQPLRLHSTTLRPVLLDSTPLKPARSALLCSLYCTLPYSDVTCSALLYSILLYSTFSPAFLGLALLYFTLLRSTPLYSTLLPSILL